MKTKIDCYPHYKKLLRVRLEEPITETQDYQHLARHYPYIAESIRLKLEMQMLEEKVKLTKDRVSKSKTRREINEIRSKQRRNSILQRLHGENREDWAYRLSFGFETLRERVFSQILKRYKTLERLRRRLGKRWHRTVQRTIPPSILDLRSLDCVEKDLMLKEWVQNRHEQVIAKARSARLSFRRKRRMFLVRKY